MPKQHLPRLFVIAVFMNLVQCFGDYERYDNRRYASKYEWDRALALTMPVIQEGSTEHEKEEQTVDADEAHIFTHLLSIVCCAVAVLLIYSEVAADFVVFVVVPVECASLV